MLTLKRISSPLPDLGGAEVDRGLAQFPPAQPAPETSQGDEQPPTHKEDGRHPSQASGDPSRWRPHRGAPMRMKSDPTATQVPTLPFLTASSFSFS